METALLHELARLYGVETAYYDLTGQLQAASADALLAILRALGAPLAAAQDVPQAIRERRQALWQHPLGPVAVGWDNAAPVLDLRLPADSADVALTGVYPGRRRMTLTYPILNRSRRILWLITGADKAAMLPRLRAADRSIPAGRVHREQALVLADRSAMGEKA